MIKNVEIWITDKCNSHCIICDTWKNKNNDYEFSSKELKKILSKKEFQNVESLQISGGEPMLREDVKDVIIMIINILPELKKITLTTNGTYPQNTLSVFKKFQKYNNIDFKLCVSLEGKREVHNKIRGINGYDLVLETIKLCKKNIPEIKMMLLTTLTNLNCNYESLNHIKKIVKNLGLSHSFRPFYSSDTHHYSNNNLNITEEQKKFLIKYIEDNYFNNDFLKAQVEFLRLGKMKFIDCCQAGELFVNIRSNGDIFPCINSKRKIGDIDQGIYDKEINNLGEYEQCSVCCDEACFYPMLNYYD